MTDRITNKMLDARVKILNALMNRALAPYTKNDDGTFQPNPGNFHISGAYGGVCLHEMSHEPGCTGVSDVFRCGHIPKRELYNRINAFIDGIETARN
jgi:hypothetical protein